MNTKNTSPSLSTRQLDILSLSKFVTPIHSTLQKVPSSISLQELSDACDKDTFIEKTTQNLSTLGKTQTQSDLYETLIKADQVLLSPTPHIILDTEHINKIVIALKTGGLFAMAKSVELLLDKTKAVQSISRVIRSKKAQAARKAKGTNTTIDEAAALEEYKHKLKVWANEKYAQDCEYQRSRNEPPRPKRSGSNAANHWLLEMALADLALDSFEPSMLDESITDSLTEEGNLYGSPEQPDNLLGFKLTSSFFYQCIKN
ncbi:hypothetical protein [Thalassotalea sp. PLHSN55]|uniref:hypothetical protein n=1 Tax=Thalassotalea sp. PLHSN55 TaxID=3435888 RepID=UPI003F879435